MAPSPTGFLHVGTARTFLFNWLFARQQGGECLLRIENTDMNREVEGATEQIQRSLTWLGLDWEALSFQLDRMERCQQEAQRLVESGHAYEDEGAIRFRMPDEGDDGVRRPRARPASRRRTRCSTTSCSSARDGRPTYNFASPVEDWLDGITHVIRGRDHISNTPKQINILRALGAELPLLRAHARRRRRRRQEALEAARRAVARRVPRHGLLRAGADELPRAARLELRRQDDDHVARRADRAVLVRPRAGEPGDVRLQEARLDERRLPARRCRPTSTRTR